MERRHSIIVCEQLPLARINERSSRSFQTEPFWYRFAAARPEACKCHREAHPRFGSRAPIGSDFSGVVESVAGVTRFRVEDDLGRSPVARLTARLRISGCNRTELLIAIGPSKTLAFASLGHKIFMISL
jgi:hypothetical protein